MVPKTEDEAEKLKKRGEKTKETFFKDLVKTVNEALQNSPGDEYLNDMKAFLETKSFKNFNPKKKLEDLTSEVDEHIGELHFQNELNQILGDGEESDLSDDEI